MDVQRVSDELEITALLSRYARAVDTKDWALYITNIESEIDGDTARVRAMFYNPTQIRESRTSAFLAAITTTNWFAHLTVGAAVTSARRRCGPSTPRAASRTHCPFGADVALVCAAGTFRPLVAAKRR